MLTEVVYELGPQHPSPQSKERNNHPSSKTNTGEMFCRCPAFSVAEKNFYHRSSQAIVLVVGKSVLGKALVDTVMTFV